ncbi:MAG: T9SS type A sorting domain-containing protein [Chitinophagaceae bacterium]|nr:T9SS type A sorting domain-containing protein [Chitinophagaceae bacterium]
MKAYPTVINFTHVFRITFRSTTLVLLFIVASLFGYSQELEFKNSTLEPGSPASGNDGAVYRFPSVTKDVDALVTIINRSSSLVKLVAIDLTSSGFDKAWQPQVTYNNGTTPKGKSDWYMEFEVAFVKKGTTVTIPVETVDVTALDLDGNGGSLSEYVTFFNQNSFTLESQTQVTVTSVNEVLSGYAGKIPGKKFSGPTTNYTNIDPTATKVMVTNKYKEVARFRVRAGAVSGGNDKSADRMYSFWFKSFTYNDPVEGSLPVKLSSFNATKKNDAKVSLDWATSQEINASHFVVERSFDGKVYDEAGLVFAIGNSNVSNSYKFTDELRSKDAAVIYYRLKMVDMDGKTEKSVVRIIRNAEQKETGVAKILTYPNPVVSELRVQMPVSWQNNAVNIEVLNSSGQIVKRQMANRAGQTEVVNVNDLGNGIYFVRASNGTESATQRIAKMK